MKNKIFNFLTKIILKLNGDDFMMALLLAQGVILENITFSQVPNSLKAQVYAILLESGVPELAGDYVPPVKP